MRTEARVVFCADPDEFVGRAKRWTPGMPFPLLPCTAVDRYHSLLESAGHRAWPKVVARKAAGQVIAVGGLVAQAAAELLSVATHRPHRHATADEISALLDQVPDEPVAVVGLAADLASIGDWPGGRDQQVGLVTARSAASLVALVHRTLTLDALHPESNILVIPPGMPLMEQADAVALDELRELLGTHHQSLTLRTYARECSAYLPDGIICGRSDQAIPAALPVAPARRTTSCLRGEGCFRADLRTDQIVSAADINTQLVFVHGCLSVAIGTNAFPLEIGLGLGFLEGVAVAVIGAIGPSLVHPSTHAVFHEAAATGASLGEVVTQLNAQVHRIVGALSRFGLLGDPALVLNPVEQFRPAVTACRDRPQPVAGLPARSPAALDRLRHLSGVVASLERLAWLDVEVDTRDIADIRNAIRTAVDAELGWRRSIAEDVAWIEDRIAALQLHTITHLLRTVHETWWQFEGRALTGLREEDARAVVCPACDTERAIHSVARHRTEPDLIVRTVQCRSCGRVESSTGDAKQLSVVGPHLYQAERGRELTVRRRLTAPESATPAAAGFVFFEGEQRGLPAGAALSWTPSGDCVDAAVTVKFADREPTPDEHTGAFIALADGVLCASKVIVSLA